MTKKSDIFTRLRILKSNIDNILQDFFDEILQDLETTLNNYKTSNNEKHLIEIKNTTGNSIEDSDLIKLASKNKEDFTKELKDLFSKKKKERIEILGTEQNMLLEKKIFLQIIDFSWRSHLQYLEQLRQVVGLRQYGQKDPLSEFKKEAFLLFESLLVKIKKDLIKLLFNLSIVVSDQEEKNQNQSLKEKKDFKKVGRNEKCPCGSGKKFKQCHGKI